MNLADYDFEFSKIIAFLRDFASAALQFPEGLLGCAACIAQQIYGELAYIELCLLTDVAYGACNVDYALLKSMGVEALIHFGHSMLLEPELPTLYVKCARQDFDPQKMVTALRAFCAAHLLTNIALVSTAQTQQFAVFCKSSLNPGISVATFKYPTLGESEVLGCTAPQFSDVQAVFSLADGRFHMEALVARNPTTDVYRVDPRTGDIELGSREILDRLKGRKALVERYRQRIYRDEISSVCIVLGALGGQGSYDYALYLEAMAKTAFPKVMKLIVAEVHPGALNLPDCELYVELACPRLTVDWPEYFDNCLNACEFEYLMRGMDIEESFGNYGGRFDVCGSHRNLYLPR